MQGIEVQVIDVTTHHLMFTYVAGQFIPQPGDIIVWPSFDDMRVVDRIWHLQDRTVELRVSRT